MSVVTLELLNDNALNLLKQLENMQIVRFVKSDIEKSPKSMYKSRFVGTISKETATLLLNHIEQSRNEWENR
jgi:hypothetical protein